MNAKELEGTLTKCLGAGFPVLVKGAPGIGKTDIIKKVAENIKHRLIISHPVVSDPTDFKGLPGIVLGQAEFLPFGELRELINAEEPTIFFLDDLGQAPAVVQAACMQLLLARRINGHAVSDKVVFVAATNRREDRAGVTGILEPVKSRFVTILELVAEADAWIDWAFQNNMPAGLIGFVHFRPTLIHTNEVTSDIVNHPCPRTFFHAGQLMNIGIDDVETLGGALGEGCAAELTGFLKVYKSLPNIAAILLKPNESVVPEEPAALYAVVSALVEKASPDNVPMIFKYGNRLPADFSTLLVRDMIRKNPKIQHSKAFIEWATTHKEVLM